MSENNPFHAAEGEAPLLPGGVPEQAGTGPTGAYPDGSVQPGEPVIADVEDSADDAALNAGEPAETPADNREGEFRPAGEPGQGEGV